MQPCPPSRTVLKCVTGRSCSVPIRTAHLIMHLAIAAGAPANPLHAAPAVVGRIAQEAHVGRLVVSHLGVYDLDAATAELKTAYTGPLIIGADLQCTPRPRQMWRDELCHICGARPPRSFGDVDPMSGLPDNGHG